MSKAKMEAARELIKEKRYSEARAILKTVDHPTAAEWVAKIDAVDSKQHSKQRFHVMGWAVLALIFGAVIVTGIIVVNQMNQDSNRIKDEINGTYQARQDEIALSQGCVRVEGYPYDFCERYAQTEYPHYQDAVKLCSSQYDPDKYITLFSKCLVEHDVEFYAVFPSTAIPGPTPKP